MHTTDSTTLWRTRPRGAGIVNAGFLTLVLSLVVLGGALSACAPSAEESSGADHGTAAEATPSGSGPSDVGGAGSEPAGPTGDATVEGHVTYSGPIPKLSAVKMEADPTCAAKHDQPVPYQGFVLGDGNGLANVLVRVTGGAPEGHYPPPDEPIVLDQRGCLYHPHVMAAVSGQELEILNSDGLLHNVHSLSKVNPFNRAMPAGVKEADYELSTPEDPFRIKCDVHPWMEAYLAVMDNPFFDVTGKDGAFTISDLPAGSYEIQAWHERLGTKTVSVEVEEGETATVDFVFERPQNGRD